MYKNNQKHIDTERYCADEYNSAANQQALRERKS